MSARLPAPVSPAFPLILLKMWSELVNNSKKFRTFAPVITKFIAS